MDVAAKPKITCANNLVYTVIKSIMRSLIFKILTSIHSPKTLPRNKKKCF